MSTKFSAFTSGTPVAANEAVGLAGGINSRWTFTAIATLVKSLVLANVDNTSDANKPVSTAQQTALDLKANLAGPTFTGTPAAPTAAAATNTTQLATTAFVFAERSNAFTMTNKTFDTAGTGNSFSVNGVALTANTGTGAMVRATSPTITTPTLSGVQTMDGSQVITRNAMGAGTAIDTSKAINTKSTSADTTFTFNAAPASGTVFQLEITNGGGTARTMTLPAGCINSKTLAAASTATLPASGMLTLSFRYNGTNYLVDGIPAQVSLATDVTGNLAAANVNSGTGASASTYLRGDMTWVKPVVCIPIAVGDETTAITTGTAKVTFRMPFAMTLTAVRASLTTVSSSGTPTVDINEGGTTILSTKLTIDASEKTSTTAATAAVISDAALADDAEITIDIDVAGTGAAGLKVYLIGTIG